MLFPLGHHYLKTLLPKPLSEPKVSFFMAKAFHVLPIVGLISIYRLFLKYILVDLLIETTFLLEIKSMVQILLGNQSNKIPGHWVHLERQVI
jgi:hypothetical protein